MPADGFYGFKCVLMSFPSHPSRYLCLIVVKFKLNERSYKSKNYIFPHRAPYLRPGESRAIVSPLIFLSPFPSDSTLDRLAHGPALLDRHPPRHIRFLRPVSHMRRIVPLQSQYL
jgi:hypothetical protein